MKKTTSLLLISGGLLWATLTGCTSKEPEVPVGDPIPQQEVVEAALNGNTALIEQALAAGYKPDSLDSENRTALIYAAYNGHTPVVKKLLEAGADVNAQDKLGSTALMFASSGPFLETVQLLIDQGAKINLTDTNEHFTALMWAASEGQAEIVKLLLKHKADVTLMDIDGDTAESFARKKGHTEIAEILQTAARK